MKYKLSPVFIKDYQDLITFIIALRDKGSFLRYEEYKVVEDWLKEEFPVEDIMKVLVGLKEKGHDLNSLKILKSRVSSIIRQKQSLSQF